jgi:hypothetical protein
VRKKTVTEVRRAMRAHALSLAELRRVRDGVGETETRLHTALIDFATEIGPPFAEPLRLAASRLREADAKVWTGTRESREEVISLASILSVRLPKKLIT